MSFARGCRCCPRRKQQDASIVYQPRLSGNMHAGREPTLRTVLVTIQPKSRQTLGTTETAGKTPIRQARNRQTHGAFLTCTGTRGSGVKTGYTTTPIPQRQIRRDQRQEHCTFCAEADGSIANLIADLPRVLQRTRTRRPSSRVGCGLHTPPANQRRCVSQQWYESAPASSLVTP